ncbi:hypothetical protein Droror1_Dr00008519 [Drosera rotundifolia]
MRRGFFSFFLSLFGAALGFEMNEQVILAIEGRDEAAGLISLVQFKEWFVRILDEELLKKAQRGIRTLVVKRRASLALRLIMIQKALDNVCLIHVKIQVPGWS